MKNKLNHYCLIGVLLLSIFGCGPTVKERQIKEQQKNNNDMSTTNINFGSAIGGTFLKTVKHTDGCDYVLWANGAGSCMIHSGNCSNPVHGRKPVF